MTKYSHWKILSLEITNAPWEINTIFYNKSNEEHQKGYSLLLKLSINVTNIVCSDYMHCV